MLCIFSFVLIAAATASSEPNWNNLRTTWDPNPFSKYGFAEMPRTVSEATKQGFKLVDDQCKEASPKFLGQRYRLGDDIGLTLLYDKNGYIAGIQTCVPKANYEPEANMQKGNPYQDDGECRALTAYFVDPKTICATGRSADDFAKTGTGDQLGIQNGSNPLTDVWTVPMNQSEMGKTLWNKGKCTPSMGTHYWFNVREDMPCTEWYPFFFLYNSGKLNAFGFAPPADISLPTPRYEHPSQFEAKTCCLSPFPTCFKTDRYQQTGNTMHVFLTHHPMLTNFC